ncbi:MAG: PIN domain-containing protein [Silvibacterium sp.]
MSRIYWDTMVFVYLVEDHPVFGSKVHRIYQRMLERRDTLCTSTLTLGEALVGSIKGGDANLGEKMKTALNGDEVELVPFRARTAEIYAEIRANFPVKSPDAIHLATAAEMKADIFLTNDGHLHRLTIPGIQFIAGLDGTIF